MRVVRVFLCPGVAAGVRRHVVEPEVACLVPACARDDVPTDPALGEVVQRRKPPGEHERVLVQYRAGGHEAQIGGSGSHRWLAPRQPRGRRLLVKSSDAGDLRRLHRAGRARTAAAWPGMAGLRGRHAAGVSGRARSAESRRQPPGGALQGAERVQPVTSGRSGSALHSVSEPSYRRASPRPVNDSANRSTVAEMPPPQ
jgi:hypothetical protein